MKTNLLITLTSITLMLLPKFNFGQTINLGTAADFVLFTSNGAVSNTGITHLTGNVGSNSAGSTAFGNVNGGMHDQDGVSQQCALDLGVANLQLNGAIPDFNPTSSIIGNGDTLVAGVYYLAGASSLNLNLYLDAKGVSGAEFIIQSQLEFSTNTNSKVILINGAKACNVFWKIGGAVVMASGTSIKGTVVAEGAITMNTGDTLEGRALSIGGAITVDGILGYTPIGCNSPVLNGPIAPSLGAVACYALFSSNGAVSNSGVTFVTGDVGSNVGSTTGFDNLNVNGNIHPNPDGSTAACANDLLNVYTYLNTLSHDIELLYPAQFGNNLVLTPHTYLLNAATVLTDSLYLDAQGNVNGVFVIKINGALSTSTYSRIKLVNGTQSKNVYWVVEGAVNINNYSIFRGTLVSNSGAIGAISTGVVLDGRCLTTDGALNTTAIDVIATMIPSNCGSVGIHDIELKENSISIYPNPFNESTNILINDASQINKAELKMYNVLGEVVLNKMLTEKLTTIETSNLNSGIYIYKIFSNNAIIQLGRLISNK